MESDISFFEVDVSDRMIGPMPVFMRLGEQARLGGGFDSASELRAALSAILQRVRVRVDFQRLRVTSDAGLILVRELDELLVSREQLIGPTLSTLQSGVGGRTSPEEHAPETISVLLLA